MTAQTIGGQEAGIGLGCSCASCYRHRADDGSPAGAPTTDARLPTIHPLQAERHGEEPSVIYLRGELDIATAPRLRERLDVVIGTAQTVTLDMAEVTFIDASAMGILASAGARSPGGLQVRGASAFITKVFNLVGLDHLLGPGP